MKTPLQLVAPWEPIDPAMASKFEDEYAAEIAKGHPFYGVPARAVGRRVDREDLLFELSECGRATSLAKPGDLGCPHLSVLEQSWPALAGRIIEKHVD